MDNISLPRECVVKVEELKEEPSDIFENGEHDVLGGASVKTEYNTFDSPVSEHNDPEDEELKPLAAMYVQMEMEMAEGIEEQDHLAADPLAGCEGQDDKKPLAASLLLRVKKEEVTEAEEDAGISNERSEQAATEEMNDVEDGSDSNRAEPSSEECEASKPGKKNVQTHNRQTFACVHCSETFRYKKTLKEHEREHREELLRCNTSQRQFSSRRAPRGHIKVHVNDAERKTKFPCETCGKEYKCRRNLKVHLRLHTGEKPYICDYCGKRFTQRCTLNEHLRIHTGERPYSCAICNMRFVSKTHLVTHTRRHLNIKPYECKECGKTFGEAGTYRRHLRVHTGEKPHKCRVCSKTFARKQSLNNHMFIHSCEQKKMSECEVCGDSFKSAYMMYHMRIHTGQKPYKCRFCEATFARSSNRKKHEETHSYRKTVQCNECGKSLLSKQNLKLHMHWHTGEKPYHCGYCDKTFARSTTCKIHEVNHTKEYRYFCAECGKGYSIKRDLANHIQTHRN